VHFFPCRDGKIVFRQGDQVRGVYILCQGGAKLSLKGKEAGGPDGKGGRGGKEERWKWISG